MKKLFLLLLAAVMVFSLAACGEDSSTPSPSGNSQSASSTPTSSTTASGLSGDIKIIPGANALDAFYVNFSITWTTFGTKYTLCRKGKDWFYASDYRQAENKDQFEGSDRVHCSAFVAGEYYMWFEGDANAPGNPRERLGAYANGLWDELLDEQLDYDGLDDFGSLSTWLQMCLDYTNGVKLKANTKHFISDTMTLIGTEEIAGVMCDVVEYKTTSTFLTDYEYAYDPQSGILFRFRDLRREPADQIQFLVTDYTENPATLGTFPG
jgi:hypothetical protein